MKKKKRERENSESTNCAFLLLLSEPNTSSEKKGKKIKPNTLCIYFSLRPPVTKHHIWYPIN